MNVTNGVVSLGGVTIGLCILAWVTVRWWQRDKPKWVPVVPFMISTLYGMLLILSAGGILGGAADIALWGSNLTGDAALEYGVGGGTQEVTRRYNLALTNGGHAMVLVITVAVAALWAFARKKVRGDVWAGILCGVCLGLASSVAGWAASILAPVVNWGGDWITGIL